MKINQIKFQDIHHTKSFLRKNNKFCNTVSTYVSDFIRAYRINICKHIKM